jgi:hypothetical protein
VSATTYDKGWADGYNAAVTQTLELRDCHRCSHCDDPTHPDDLVLLDDQKVCAGCRDRLTGEDVGGPSEREL